MIEELRHELVRLTYSPEIVSFELTREQGLEILEEIKRLNKENEHLRTALNSKESIIKEVREYCINRTQFFNEARIEQYTFSREEE